jgi:ribosome-binding protein aMBF1 (putative translation factor)
MARVTSVRNPGPGFAELFAEAEKYPDYWAELAIIGFTEDVWAAMESKGLSRAELARRLGTSQAYVTKVLRGNVNFTLRSMARLAMALDMELSARLQPRRAEAEQTTDAEMLMPPDVPAAAPAA